MTAPSNRPGIFTVAEYAADPSRAVDYATKHGTARVLREDGSVRVVISIPPAEVKGGELSDEEIADAERLCSTVTGFNQTRFEVVDDDPDEGICLVAKTYDIDEPYLIADDMERYVADGLALYLNAANVLAKVLPRALAALREEQDLVTDWKQSTVANCHDEDCSGATPSTGEAIREERDQLRSERDALIRERDEARALLGRAYCFVATNQRADAVATAIEAHLATKEPTP